MPQVSAKTRYWDVDQSSVLIVSDDPEFSRTITGRWQSERHVPGFTLMGGDVCQGADGFNLAIIGGLNQTRLAKVIDALRPSGKTLLVIADSSSVGHLRNDDPKVLVLRQHEGWLDALVMVGTEVLRRIDALRRAEEAEFAKTTLLAQATLGRYMLDMRHSLNNALTSILGNAELLLLEPGSLSAPVRSQVDTIRNMGMRMHEVLQRFSSLETELKFSDQQAERERSMKVQAAAAS